MKYVKSTGAIGAVLFMSACFDTSDADTNPTPTNMTYEQQAVATVALLDASGYFDATDLYLYWTDPATLPTSGSAAYNGHVAISTEDTATAATNEMIGVITLNADFANSTVSGQATGFVDSTDAAYSGTITLATATIDRTTDLDLYFTYGSTVNGTITDSTGVSHTVSGGYAGDFVGTDYSYVDGIVYGDVSSSDGSSAIFGGFYIAER